jgi:hypothetical protein
MDSILYVTAFEVSRNWGGPEEGGWWYDSGVPLASIPCRTEVEVDEAKERLESIFKPQFEGNRSRFSVLGQSNLLITVEDDVAAPFPSERPHYE